MANRRAQKVARFKHQKAAQTKLQEIRERKERRGRSLSAAALSAPIEAREEDDLEDDGEEEREAWLATISYLYYRVAYSKPADPITCATFVVIYITNKAYRNLQPDKVHHRCKFCSRCRKGPVRCAQP